MQDQAIALWPHAIVGWKVGYIAEERRLSGGDDRLLGPIWDHQVQVPLPETGAPFPEPVEGPTMPIFTGGFAAVEAELILRLGADQPDHDGPWTPEDVDSIPTRLYGGIEIASSPIPDINALGPQVVTADFGNNNGLVLGPEITDWTSRDLATIAVTTELDGQQIGTGTPDNLPGGLRTSFANALTIMARRGRPLKTGDLLATGALTGIHEAAAGQQAVVTFGDIGLVGCRLA